MNRMPHRLFLLLAIAALALVTPASIHAWELKDTTLERVPIPLTLHPIAAGTSADFDQDGVPETLLLTQGRATIQTGDQIRWQSPGTWQVRQALIADLNRDGLPEAALLVWRPFQPWPVDAWLPSGGRIDDFHDSHGMSCHIILIGWYQDSFRERWAGSALIWGHHPHVLQPAEWINDGKTLALYSLGNALFDQYGLEAARRSALVLVRLDLSGVQELEVVPFRIDARNSRLVEAGGEKLRPSWSISRSDPHPFALRGRRGDWG